MTENLSNLQVSSNLNSAVVWMISSLDPVSMSSSFLTKPLWTVPRFLTTFGISVSFIFHRFLSSLAKSKYLCPFSLSFIFTLWFSGTVKLTLQVLFFLLSYWLFLILVLWSGLRDLSVTQITRWFYAFHFSERILFVYVPFVVKFMVKFQFLAQFPVDHLSHSLVLPLL